MTDDFILQLQTLRKSYEKATTPAVDGVSLDLAPGNILGLLGPSGCGKTTLLRLIAGFEKPEAGQVILNGQIVAASHRFVPPEKRQISMVFQDFALFPHLTVAQNVGFGLVPGQGRLWRSRLSPVQRQRVKEVLQLVRLQDLSGRYPHELSGGQQQRVALARALAPRPSLILLDEPLSNLDVQVRLRLREELRRILKDSGSTAVFVTHDQEEAMALADEIAVMRCGLIEQRGTPESIYLHPHTPFVAEFVSQVNFLRANYGQQGWQTEVGLFRPQMLVASPRQTQDETGLLMIREEDLQLRPDPQGEVTICDRQFLGREYRYCLRTASGQELHARCADDQPWSIGTTVSVSAPLASLQVFQAEAAGASLR
ncbi:ABC transporter ATP-binding protein [Lyngbya confervoides]|uniref:ABC-type quaternary amine transporter n=1 Tax=Lyngbya confervoides BDU141951 TaxID=1574623 RepID=A0ABD4T5E9_9CYAN|nr:ABC transporter ATP-binding protein [Lyngbya confervoides]MCM1983472.1 ABC transporter ATP-binding protein [Lyngbya confervoides BDU141951]